MPTAALFPFFHAFCSDSPSECAYKIYCIIALSAAGIIGVTQKFGKSLGSGYAHALSSDKFLMGFIVRMHPMNVLAKFVGAYARGPAFS